MGDAAPPPKTPFEVAYGLELRCFGLSVSDVLGTSEYSDIMPTLDVLELWCGVGSIYKAARKQGYAGHRCMVNVSKGDIAVFVTLLRPERLSAPLLVPGSVRSQHWFVMDGTSKHYCNTCQMTTRIQHVFFTTVKFQR